MATAGALGRRENWRLLQSDFGTPDHNGNFEVVVRQGTDLVHYFHDNSDVRAAWQRAQVISAQATGPGSIIQSDFGTPVNHGNFEVVVLEGNNLVHYFHDNSNVALPWERAQVISARATGPGSIIQSNLQTSTHGNFEVVVLEGHDLVHYFHDNSNVGAPWERAQVITTRATGPGSIIQSDFRSGTSGNFELVVLEENNLVHYFHDNSNVGTPWQRAQVITTRATGPGSIIQSDFRPGANGNFEIVVLEGNNLVHYFHDNSNVGAPWQRAQIISAQASGVGSIIQSDFQSGANGNFEVVVPEGNNLVHYFHDNSDARAPWQRAQVISAGS